MAVPVAVPGDPASPLEYTVPGSTAFVPRAASATFDGSGAAGAFLPTMTWLSQSGEVLGRYTAPEVAAGSSAEVSWFPWRRIRSVASRLVLDYNLGEIVDAVDGTLGDRVIVQPVYQPLMKGDGILILAAAPSLPSGGALIAHPFGVNDDPGNVYTVLGNFAYEAAVPNVNQGIYATLFWCPSSVADFNVGVDSFDVIWDNNCYDRVVSIWSVRHSGGANTPTVLAATADNDAAVFASAQVTLQAPNFTPAREKALMFAIILTAKVGGTGAFGAVGGFSGFFQAQFRQFVGSKQIYYRNPQTHGADAYLIAGAVASPYEDDVGVLPGGVLVPAFNGVGQTYSAGANAWKGIILLGLD